MRTQEKKHNIQNLCGVPILFSNGRVGFGGNESENMIYEMKSRIPRCNLEFRYGPRSQKGGGKRREKRKENK